MMLFLQDKLKHFQDKISTYDKANWEIIVEKYKSKTSLYNMSKRKRNLNDRLLIDLDLFRGKKFQKAKPVYHWTNVTLKAALKIFFYPFFYRWWIDQLALKAFVMYLLIYMLLLCVLLVYLFNDVVKSSLTFLQSCSSLFIVFFVGEIYVHVISTNLSRPGHSFIRSKNEGPQEYSRLIPNDTLLQTNFHLTTSTNDVNIYNRRRASKRSTSVKPPYNCESDGCVSDLVIKPPVKSDNRHCSDCESPISCIPSDAATSDALEPNDSENGPHISHSSSSLSESEEKAEPFSQTTSPKQLKPEGRMFNPRGHIQEEVVVTLFEDDGVKKFKMSIWEIVEIIEDRVNTHLSEYKYFWVIFTICLYFSFFPIFFELSRLCFDKYLKEKRFRSFDLYLIARSWLKDAPAIVLIQLFFVSLIRFFMVGSYLFLLCVTERTYGARYLYAKYFAALTSSRRARRNHLPHFRLHKVKNIKAWLSLRSYLRRNGPLRSIDIVVSSTFYLSIIFVTIVCSQLLINTTVTDLSDNGFLSKYPNWEITSWAILFSSFLLRFMSQGAEVNRTYDNHSELLTEQINLYLQMEITPQKKEEFIISNNVLKLASKLLKDIEAPSKVTGFIMNPLLRDITKVVVLSLISGVISELLGVRFKFWKIKAG